MAPKDFSTTELWGLSGWTFGWHQPEGHLGRRKAQGVPRGGGCSSADPCDSGGEPQREGAPRTETESGPAGQSQVAAQPVQGGHHKDKSALLPGQAAVHLGFRVCRRCLGCLLRVQPHSCRRWAVPCARREASAPTTRAPGASSSSGQKPAPPFLQVLDARASCVPPVGPSEGSRGRSGAARQRTCRSRRRAHMLEPLRAHLSHSVPGPGEDPRERA